MPVYKFTVPSAAAGQAYRIVDTAGAQVATGTVPAEATAPGEISFSLTIATAGTYSTQGVNAPWLGGLEFVGELDIENSIEAGGGVGAAETAYFVATGPSDVSDGGGNVGNLNFVADTRHDALPSWASLNGGDVALSDDAGSVAYSLVGLYDYDFSATTPQGSGGNLSSAIDLTLDSTTVSTNGGDNETPGDGQDAQTGAPVRLGGVGAFTAISCVGYPRADDVADGVASPRFALTVTRVAQAAIIPD